MVRNTLFEAVEETMRIILSHLKVAFEIKGDIERQEILEYPKTAIRELVLNAFVHSDIQIKIFDQSITIFNPGKLFGGLTIKDLQGYHYASRSRNKLIAEAFYLTKDIEKYGSGFIRVREAIKTYPPMNFEFMEIGDGFLAKLSYVHQKIELGGANGDKNRALLDIEKLIQKESGINTRGISQKLGLPPRTVERAIKTLRERGDIKFQGASKTGGYYWLSELK